MMIFWSHFKYHIGMSQGLRRTYKVRRYNFDEDEKSAESSGNYLHLLNNLQVVIN